MSQILTVIEKDFWSMVMAGYRLWPMLCLPNLFVVPLDHQMLVGNVAAFGWGSLSASRNDRRAESTQSRRTLWRIVDDNTTCR